MKKINGDLQQSHYVNIDQYTGEITNRAPEYTNMSLKPGIGAKWFDQHKGDVYPDDFVTIAGKKHKVPRYYDKLLRRQDGDDALAAIKESREALMALRHEDNTPERLAVRETVQKSRLTNLKRELHDS